MSMKIVSISLYSFDGDCRTVSLKPSGLNVITGKSKTGKSSIIDIIDYCLGRAECYVADGVIRERVSWFGLHLKNGPEELFIARRNPPRNKSMDPDVYIQRGAKLSPPNYPDLKPNIPVNELESLVTRFAGIGENEHRPVVGTRNPLRANIRHALFLCFQKQDEMASRDRLFHRQGDPFIPQAIKDTLPFFLGAVDQQHFSRQNELDDALSALKKLQAEKSAAEATSRNMQTRVRQFLLEAKSLGLVEQTYEPIDGQAAIEALLHVSQTADAFAPDFNLQSEQVYFIQDQLSTLRSDLEDVQNEIRATRLFFSEQSSYSRETHEQRDRLRSLGLYKSVDHSSANCPVCDSELNHSAISASALNAALENLDGQLQAILADSPQVQSRIDLLNKKRTEIQFQLVETQRLLEKAYVEDARAKSIRDQSLNRARVIGRIAAFVEQMMPSELADDLDKRIKAAEVKYNVLAEGLGAEDIAERVQSILNIVAEKMSEYAGELDLEHAGGSIRLDIKRLTVIADTLTGPVQLNRMGSGENWVGYHVVTLLALHHWFRQTNQPVPGFLIFDQPTQAHYPPESDVDGRLDSLIDEDRQAVKKLFELMYSAAREIGRDFQLIVLDHAHLDEDWFEQSIVEEWRGNDALVPLEWLN